MLAPLELIERIAVLNMSPAQVRNNEAPGPPQETIFQGIIKSTNCGFD